MFVADDSKIWLYEAAILFVLYMIYVLIMKFNEQLKETVTEMLTGKKKVAKGERAVDEVFPLYLFLHSLHSLTHAYPPAYAQPRPPTCSPPKP